MIFDQLRTLPLQFKLVLYAFLTAPSRDKKKIKVTITDVFLEYKKVANGLKVEWLSLGRVSDLIKELEMLSFVKCRYIHKSRGQIRHVHILEPVEIPKYISALQEELRKVPQEQVRRGQK